MLYVKGKRNITDVKVVNLESKENGSDDYDFDHESNGQEAKQEDNLTPHWQETANHHGEDLKDATKFEFNLQTLDSKATIISGVTSPHANSSLNGEA